MTLELTTNQVAVVIESLFRAADAQEDIDDPRHYSNEDLRLIAEGAKEKRELAIQIRALARKRNDQT